MNKKTNNWLSYKGVLAKEQQNLPSRYESAGRDEAIYCIGTGAVDHYQKSHGEDYRS